MGADKNKDLILQKDEVYTLFNEINWVLKTKYNIDRNEIFKIIIDRFNDDLKNEEVITLKGIEKQNNKLHIVEVLNNYMEK